MIEKNDKQKEQNVGFGNYLFKAHTHKIKMYQINKESISHCTVVT